MNITVLTASLPERAGMLTRNMTSIANQTLTPTAHLVAVDYARAGGAATYNGLLQAVDTDWFACLDDDDTADPNHLELMAEEAGSGQWDVVYTWCRCEGRDFTQYNQGFDPTIIATSSIVPITALCRTALARDVGGFPDTWDYDRAFWVAIHQAGGRFIALPQETWTYVYHGANQSHGQLRSSA